LKLSTDRREVSCSLIVTAEVLVLTVMLTFNELKTELCEECFNAVSIHCHKLIV